MDFGSRIGGALSDEMPGKEIVVDGRRYMRYPLQTRVLTADDTILDVVQTYAWPHYQPGDIVFISETAVSIMQGRARPWTEIEPSWIAEKLASYVTKSPYGVGLRSPFAMQYAIELCGLPAILGGCIAHVVGKLLKQDGWFYKVAGPQARMMDAEHTMGVPEYYECVVPGPENAEEVCYEMKSNTQMDMAIVDVNDIYPAWCIASTLLPEEARLLEQCLTDNPLGQGDECTPLGIWRKVLE
jgi:F420-0:gamma-glutamyl ligase-like protein